MAENKFVSVLEKNKDVNINLGQSFDAKMAQFVQGLFNQNEQEKLVSNYWKNREAFIATKPTPKVQKIKVGGLFFDALGILSGSYGVIAGVTSASESRFENKVARGYLDKKHYHTKWAVDTAAVSVETTIFAGELIAMSASSSAAGPLGLAAFIVGGVAIGVPYALDYRQEKIKSNNDLALDHHASYQQYLYAQEHLIDRIINRNFLEQGVLTFKQTNEALVIDKIDLRSNQVKLETSHSLYLIDFNNADKDNLDEWNSLSEVLENAANRGDLNDQNKYVDKSSKPSENIPVVPKSKLYNTHEDFTDVDALQDHFERFKQQSPQSSIDAQVNTVILPTFKHQYRVYKGKRITGSRTGVLTLNQLLGMNINRAIEKKMGYKRAIHVTESFEPLEFNKIAKKFDKINVNNLNTSVEVLLPERHALVYYPVSLFDSTILSANTNQIQFTLEGFSKKYVYSVASELFSNKLKTDGDIAATISLTGNGKFIVFLPGDDLTVSPTDKRALEVKQEGRTLRINTSMNDSSEIHIFQLTKNLTKGKNNNENILLSAQFHSENIMLSAQVHSYDITNEGIQKQVYNDDHIQALIKTLESLNLSTPKDNLQNLKNEEPIQPIQPIHKLPLTLFLSNHTHEVGFVKIKLQNSNDDIMMKFGRESTLELKLKYNIDEIESIQFSSNKIKNEEDLKANYKDNTFTNEQLRDYINVTSRLPHLCFNIQQKRALKIRKYKPRASQDVCSLREKYTAYAGFSKPLDHLGLHVVDEYRLAHGGRYGMSKDNDYTTIDLWNVGKKLPFYVTFTYEYMENVYALTLTQKVVPVTKYGPDMLSGTLIKSDKSRIRLYIPKKAKIKTFKIHFYGNGKKEVFDLLEENNIKNKLVLKYIKNETETETNNRKNVYITLDFPKMTSTYFKVLRVYNSIDPLKREPIKEFKERKEKWLRKDPDRVRGFYR